MEKCEECGLRKLTGQVKFQISYATEDGNEMMIVRDAVEKVPGFSCLSLLNEGVQDNAWYREWLAGLVGADGVIVMATSSYYYKMNRGNAVWKEAMAIMARKKIDPQFRIYVVDPFTPKQCASVLRCWLMDEAKNAKGEHGANDKHWNDQLAERECAIDSDTVSHTLVAYVRAGKANTEQDFTKIVGEIATYLSEVHPTDTALLLGTGLKLNNTEVVQKCKSSFVKGFSQLSFSDLSSIQDHLVLAELFDRTDLAATEDEVFEAVLSYINSSGLSPDRAESLWATCRFAFLSADTCNKVSQLCENIPPKVFKWVSLGLARKGLDGDALTTWIEARKRDELAAHRFQPRSPAHQDRDANPPEVVQAGEANNAEEANNDEDMDFDLFG